jgi:uncharacterized Ntn-hydrolase superfamily protein
MTFSVVARDPTTGDLGGAVQSKFPAVGAAVLHARAGVGVVATQALCNVSYGARGLALLEAGASPTQALAVLTGSDDLPERRQAGIVDAAGGVAAHTGGGCQAWAGHQTGAGYACQGNILVSAATVDAMVMVIRDRLDLPFPERLVAALAAGQEAGGDARGQQSAALLIVRVGGGYGGRSDRLVDLRVDDHRTPIDELARLVALHRLHFDRPRDEDLLLIDQPLGAEITARLEHLRGEPTVSSEPDALWVALERWAGAENLEERMVKRGFVDRAVLKVLRDRSDGSGASSAWRETRE